MYNTKKCIKKIIGDNKSKNNEFKLPRKERDSFYYKGELIMPWVNSYIHKGSGKRFRTL